MESKVCDKPKVISKMRTAGDGMESANLITEMSLKPEAISKHNLLPGRLIQVFASKMLNTERNNPSVHSKTPKFVPYEPYRAAVKSIVPDIENKNNKKISRNNMDINLLINQMAQMDTQLNEFKPRRKLTSHYAKSNYIGEECSLEKIQMNKEIERLKKENDSLNDQLKQQAQVNKELKTMLVASMGEDLETQVQSLNDDKKHLAKALLNSAQHLSTHQEQTEWLAGQCEVWRSKFLASSLMVEELANWKKILTQRTEDLNQAMKQIFDERCRAREMLLCIYRNLYSLQEGNLKDAALSEYLGNELYKTISNVKPIAINIHTSNILDLATANLKLSEHITDAIEKRDISHIYELPSETDGEKIAERIISTPLEVKKVNEDPVNALVNFAYTNSSDYIAKPIASCMYCNGQVQLL